MQKTKLTMLIIFLLFSIATLVWSQDFLKRLDTDVLLDPQGVVLSGAGQDGVACANSFDNYWRTAPEGQKPVLYMDYMDIWNMRPDWSNDLKDALMRYHRKGFYIIPQMGLNIEHQYKDINAGLMETELENFIEGLKYLGIPMLLRIGYEFNNGGKLYGGNNRDPEGYKNCFIAVATKVKESGLEVATVWDASLSGETNLIENWYPGDEYVDWYGFNPFSDIYNGQHAVTIEICTAAEERKKPVLIGESSPQWLNGSNTGSLDWFEVFYKMIGERPTIKALGYINWDWDVEDMVAGNMGFGWGDARLEAFPKVEKFFFEQLKHPSYFHASSEKEFRALLAYDDDTPPTAATGLKKNGDFLVWNEVTDQGGSNLAHYTIYKDDKLWDYIVGTKYPIKDLGVGGSTKVSVDAIDRAGNQGAKSATLKVEQVKSIDLIENGKFDLPMTSIGFDWTFRTANDGDVAPDKFVINDSGMITGPYSGELKWTKGVKNPAVWKIQFYQQFLVKQGTEYKISFKARAQTEMDATVGLIANAIEYKNTHVQWGNDLDFENEWHKYKMQNIKIGTEAQEYNFTATVDRDDIARLSFMFGNAQEANTVWVDDVSLINDIPNPVTNPQTTPGFNNGHLKVQSFPNPCKTNTTINYSLKQKAKVTIAIYTLSGYLVKILIRKNQAPGKHSLNWNVSTIPSGVYFYRINVGKLSEIKKIVVKR